MQLTFVSSSHLAAVGYDAARRTLKVQFRDGSIYEYSNVPESVHSGLMSASSHGEYFDANVKKAGYSYHQIR